MWKGGIKVLGYVLQCWNSDRRCMMSFIYLSAALHAPAIGFGREGTLLYGLYSTLFYIEAFRVTFSNDCWSSWERDRSRADLVRYFWHRGLGLCCYVLPIAVARLWVAFVFSRSASVGSLVLGSAMSPPSFVVSVSALTASNPSHFPAPTTMSPPSPS